MLFKYDMWFVGIEPKETEEAELHKSVLFQLQALFAFLQVQAPSIVV